MALFTVNRYLGEEGEEEEEEEEKNRIHDEKIDPLEKLKAAAIKRKAEREAEEKRAKKLKKGKKAKKGEKEFQQEEAKPVPDEEESESQEVETPAAETRPDDASTGAKTPLLDADAEPRPDEIGGFTLLSQAEHRVKTAVDRVLPEWLAQPSVIPVDLGGDAALIADDPFIDDRFKASLRRRGILHFFPVQRHVIPFLLSSLRAETLFLDPGFLRPHDVCVSAPTGSGKTLAFVVPLLQALSHRVTIRVRALVVLPVKDLAVQVYKVFATHAASLGLKVGLAVSGHEQSLAKERASLLTRSHLSGEYHSRVDILVATPGRLVDHLQTSAGFSLRHLRFLVIDEADRMMEDVKQDWLEMVERAALRGDRLRAADPRRSLCLGGLDEPVRPVYPLQKLLFSATLSQNSEKLETLRLFQPKLFTSVSKPVLTRGEKAEGGEEVEEEEEDASLPAGQFVGKYTTPSALTEYTCFVKNPSMKPLLVLYFMARLKFKRVLVFANTKENARRLLRLTRGFDGGSVSATEFSSNLNAGKRERILKRFDREEVDMIICTDAMARGMDVPGVKWVISYDCPIYVKVGRWSMALECFQ